MAEEFLPDADVDVPPIDRPIAPRRRRKPVRIIVVGVEPAVTTTIYTLFIKEFAEVYEWSDFIPEPNTGKMMSVLTKYVNLD